jgi:hypothetical protein
MVRCVRFIWFRACPLYPLIDVGTWGKGGGIVAGAWKYGGKALDWGKGLLKYSDDAIELIGASKSAVRIPGRVQSRINISNKGFGHVEGTHFNPSKAANKSQFSITPDELKSLISSKSTVGSPVRVSSETGNFIRTVTTNRTVGNVSQKMGGYSTKSFQVVSDKYGNLITAYPHMP